MLTNFAAEALVRPLTRTTVLSPASSLTPMLVKFLNNNNNNNQNRMMLRHLIQILFHLLLLMMEMATPWRNRALRKLDETSAEKRLRCNIK